MKVEDQIASKLEIWIHIEINNQRALEQVVRERDSEMSR